MTSKYVRITCKTCNVVLNEVPYGCVTQIQTETRFYQLWLHQGHIIKQDLIEK